MDEKSKCPRCEEVFYSNESDSDYCTEYCEIHAFRDLCHSQKKKIKELEKDIGRKDQLLATTRHTLRELLRLFTLLHNAVNDELKQSKEG